MLDIDQKERMTVQEALSHSYMKPFRKDDEEACDICPELTISMSDDHKSSVSEYRDTLYESLRAMRKDSSSRMKNFFKLGR